MSHFTYYRLALLYFLVQKTISECFQGSYLNLCDYNDNEREATDDDEVCDCQKKVFCTVFEFSAECNTTEIKLDENLTRWNDLKCELSSKVKKLDFETLNITEGCIPGELFTEPGKYTIACSQQDNVTPNTNWAIEGVTPVESSIGSYTELQITILKNNGKNESHIWCTLKTPDNDTEILSAVWLSDTQISCSGFLPAISGLFLIGISTNLKEIDFSKFGLRVTAKHPNTKQSNFGHDLNTIYIYFDVNIEVESICGIAFCQNIYNYNCTARGNILVVKINEDKQIICVEITNNNKIYPVGALGSEYSAVPGRLTLPETKISGSSFSFYFINTKCGTNRTEDYLSLKVVASSGLEIVDHNPGKRHRKNLMIWRAMRRSKLNPQTDVLPVLERLSSPESFFQSGSNTKMSAAVAVVVKSPPEASVLVVETNVTFCDDSTVAFYYEWFVNDEPKDGGSILIVENLPPGKYLVRCLVVAESSEILGQGWAITELFEPVEKVIIIPAEVAVGVSDDILLRAVTTSSVSWSCTTSQQEQCILPPDLYLNSPVLSLPPGSLPPGRYVWSVGDTTANIIIQQRTVATVEVTPPVFVTSSETLVLNGTIKSFLPGCVAWWTCLRRKEFDYIKLQSIREKIQERNVPLVIPPGSLHPDGTYLFKLQAFCPGSDSGYMSFPISVSAPDFMSPLIVEPTTGKALITDFSILRIDAVGKEPLVYEWSYLDPCDVEVPITRGASPRHVTTYLPPGDLKVIVRVCDLRGTCSVVSSPVISVSQYPGIPRDNFKKIRNQIKVSMTSGNTRDAFGLATTVFKSLALTAESKERQEFYSTVEETTRARVEYLRRKMQNDSEVLEQAKEIAKYFKKESDFVEYLKTATGGGGRKTRSAEPTDDAIFKAHSATLATNDTIRNRMELMKDVRKYMLKICGQSSINSDSIESQIVNINITKLPPEIEPNKTFTISWEGKFKLKLGGKFPKQRICLCIARFSRDLLGNTKDSRLTPIYEIQMIRNGKFLKAPKNDTMDLRLIFLIPDPPVLGIDCMTWTKNRGWSLKCILESATHDGVVCICKDFGYHSAFLQEAAIATGGKKTHFGGSATTILSEWDSAISFKLKEDFVSTVGSNSKSFRDSLKRQIALQLKIPEEAISYLFIKPGSIHVTVFFVDVRDVKAESAVMELVSMLHSGNLQLTAPNNTSLNIDQNDLKMMVSPPRRTGGMRYIACGVLVGTILVIIAIFSTIVGLRRKKRERMGMQPRSESPTYRLFQDEFSLDGSRESLAVYRRSSPRGE